MSFSKHLVPVVVLESKHRQARLSLWRQAAVSFLALSAAVITACGGGGEASSAAGTASTSASSTTASGSTAATTGSTSSTSTEVATAYAAGPITGFGSIIVNGIRYDDSSAVVTDDSGQVVARDKLKLGTMVTLDGTSVNATTATGRALRIRMGSEIIGPVTAVDTTAGTLTVLGQAITLTSTTVFDSSLSSGLSAVQVGAIVEVHALYNASAGTYTAVRIESESGTTAYKLRGTVANLDTTAKTFTIGGQVINYGSLAAASVPSTLANGQLVRVLLQTAQVNGQWVATALGNSVNKPSNGIGAHLRGAITVFTSATDFEINGIKVDASSATFPDGQTGIVLGAVVEVHGATTNGVVVATKVELDDNHASDRHMIELHGTVSELNTTSKTFKLRGLTVDYSSSTLVWKDGTAASLADGKSIEAKGVLSASRTQLVASIIEFE